MNQLTNYFSVSKKASIYKIREMRRKRVNLSAKQSISSDPIILSSDDEDLSVDKNKSKEISNEITESEVIIIVPDVDYLVPEPEKEKVYQPNKLTPMPRKRRNESCDSYLSPPKRRSARLATRDDNLILMKVVAKSKLLEFKEDSNLPEFSEVLNPSREIVERIPENQELAIPKRRSERIRSKDSNKTIVEDQTVKKASSTLQPRGRRNFRTRSEDTKLITKEPISRCQKSKLPENLPKPPENGLPSHKIPPNSNTTSNIEGNKYPTEHCCNELAPVPTRPPDITYGENTHITPTKSSTSPSKLNRTPSQYPVPKLKYDFDTILGNGDLTPVLDESDDEVIQQSDDCILIEPIIPLINLIDESGEDGQIFESPMEKKIKPFEIIQKPKLEPGAVKSFKHNKQITLTELFPRVVKPFLKMPSIQNNNVAVSNSPTQNGYPNENSKIVASIQKTPTKRVQNNEVISLISPERINKPNETPNIVESAPRTPNKTHDNNIISLISPINSPNVTPKQTQPVPKTPNKTLQNFAAISPAKIDNPNEDSAHVKFTMHILQYVFNHSQHKLLFTPTQFQIYKTLQTLQTVQPRYVTLCIRLFYRKFGWHRWANLKENKDAAKFCSDLTVINLSELAKLDLLDLDLSKASLEELLKLLNSSELQGLGKKYKLKLGKKGDIISEILNHASKKTGVAAFFKSSKAVGDVVIKDVREMVGLCICLRDDVKTILGRAQLLFGINDYETRQELYRLMFDYMQKPMCLRFTLDEPKLFPNEAFLAEYETYRFLCEDLTNTIEKKDNARALEVILTAYQKFNMVLADDQHQKHVEELPAPFLKRFTPGHCLCVILSTGLVILKQESKKASEGLSNTYKKLLEDCFQSQLLGTEHVLQILDTLLSPRNIWKENRKVDWLHEKLLILRTQKDFDQVQAILIDAFKSDNYKKSELFTLNLCSERQLLPKKLELTPELQELFKTHDKKYAFPETVIYADKIDVAINGNRKSTFQSRDMFGGINYLSVEQVAINYYKEYENFEEGLHCEGLPIYALYILFFWDLIYEKHVPNTFISPLQRLPLDLYSRNFYESRKTEIDHRLEEMFEWSEQDYMDRIQYCFQTKELGYCHFNFDRYDCSMLQTICSSLIRKHIIVNICKKLAQEHGTYYAGFPDLILWKTTPVKSCIFVEVKGPGDKLRPKQKLWLQFFQEIEARAEVCYVKDKSLKSLSPSKSPKKLTPQNTPHTSPKKSPYSSPNKPSQTTPRKTPTSPSKTPQSSARNTPTSSRKTPQSSPRQRQSTPKKKVVRKLNLSLQRSNTSDE